MNQTKCLYEYKKNGATMSMARSSGEKAAVCFLWGKVFLQILISLFSSVNVYFAYFVLLLPAIIWVFENTRIKVKDYTTLIYFLLICVVYVFFNIVFRYNNLTFDYLEQFVELGLFCIIFTYSVRDYKKFLKWNSICATVTFLIFCTAPFIGFEKFGISDYMVFGLEIMLPAYISMVVGRRYFKKRKLLIAEILCFFELVAFANRSCVLSVVFLWIMIYIVDIKKKTWHLQLCVFLMVVGLLCLLSIDKIILELDRLLFPNGSDSYFWLKLVEFARSKDINLLLSGRITIWKNAIAMIKERPFIGYGMADFESKYGLGYYAHNIVLEMFVEMGIVIALLLMVWFIIGLRRVIKKQNKAVIYALLFYLCMAFPALLLSGVYIKNLYLWGCVALLIKYGKKRTLKKKHDK